MKIESWLEFRIDNADVDLEHHTVSGVFISEEPNNLDQIFDYATSKPLISKWSRGFQNSTNGKSFGNVRVMHGANAVGIITALKFDDKAKAISGTVHITDDDEWKKVAEHVYTGFSFGGDSKGALWKDKIASAKYGRLMRRYTFDPRELSLCDKGRIPGTEFTEIHNADTQEATMPEPTDDKGENIENGMTTSGYFGQVLATAASLIQMVEREENSEGQGNEIPNALKEALKPFAEAIKVYQAAQIDELVDTGVDLDGFAPDDSDIAECCNADTTAGTVENGDVPGHAFGGNQHAPAATSGKGSRIHNASAKASKDAYGASIKAVSDGTEASHGAAMKMHGAAATAAEKAGRSKLAAYHQSQAEQHSDAKIKIKNEADLAGAEASARAAQESHKSEAGHAMDTKGVPAGESIEPVTPVDKKIMENADIGKILEAVTSLTTRFDALEAKVSTPVQNADTAPATPAKQKPYTGPATTFTREQEAGTQINNADVELDKEATRIASLPPEQRGVEVMKVALRSAQNSTAR